MPKQTMSDIYIKYKRSETHNKDNCQILEDCVYRYAQELLFKDSQRDYMMVNRSLYSPDFSTLYILR